MSTTGLAASRILKLDEAVVNRIAAGEVVQRPSAAIKEMLENCLDAGATSIIVTIKGGGMQLMQIQDNGHGIHRDDLAVVCERFTTSKLSTFEDLKTISTFGFRGEALASITHVAHVTITSRTADSPCAYKAKYSDGKLVSGKPAGGGGKTTDAAAAAAAPVPCAGTVGTTITVEDLFYNMSTRKLAFKNLNEQYQRVLDVVTRYSIHFASRKEEEGEEEGGEGEGQQGKAKGGVSFTCKKHGSVLADLHTTAAASTDEAIKIAYGAAVARELLKISFQSTGSSGSGSGSGSGSAAADSGASGASESSADHFSFRVRGRLSNANYSSKRGMLILFINNRLVESPSIKRTAEALYEDLLPKHTHPFVYLSIDMPAHHVDVNVHPTKKEVHFLYETELLRALHSHIGQLLAGANASRTFYTPALQAGVFDPEGEAGARTEAEADGGGGGGEGGGDAYGVTAPGQGQPARQQEAESSQHQHEQPQARGDREEEERLSKKARGFPSSSSSSSSALPGGRSLGAEGRDGEGAGEGEEEQWDEDSHAPSKPHGNPSPPPLLRRNSQIAHGEPTDASPGLANTRQSSMPAPLNRGSSSSSGSGSGSYSELERIEDSDETSDDDEGGAAAGATADAAKTRPTRDSRATSSPRGGGDGNGIAAAAGAFGLRSDLRNTSAAAAAAAVAAPRPRAAAAAAAAAVPYNPSRLVRVDASQVRIDSVFQAAYNRPPSASASASVGGESSHRSENAAGGSQEQGQGQGQGRGQGQKRAAEAETESDDDGAEGSGWTALEEAGVLMCGSCGDVPTSLQAAQLDATHSGDTGPASAAAAAAAAGGGGRAGRAGMLVPSDCACCGSAGTMSLRQAQQQRRRLRRDASTASTADTANNADPDANDGSADNADADADSFEDMPAPSYAFAETSVDYDSVRSLLQEIQAQRHGTLQQALSQYSFVGVVDARWTAVQSGTRLLLLDHCRIARLLCYQLALRRFGALPAVPLQTPVSVRACVLGALQSEEAQWSAQDGPQWDIASRVAARLLDKGPMLREYFSLGFAVGAGLGSAVGADNAGAGAENEKGGEEKVGAADSDTLLTTIPEILPCYRPQPEHLGMFLLRLATDTPWEQEKECFQAVAAQLGDFYSRLSPHADDGGGASSSSSSPSASSSSSSSSASASVSVPGPSTHLQSTVSRLVLPAMRACLVVPAACATDGTVVQAAALEQLYKIFERC